MLWWGSRRGMDRCAGLAKPCTETGGPQLPDAMTSLVSSQHRGNGQHFDYHWIAQLISRLQAHFPESLCTGWDIAGPMQHVGSCRC